MAMSSKERMYAVIEGRQPDCFPVAPPYVILSNADHWSELTGLPVWKFYEWRCTTNLDWHSEIYRTLYDRLPYDMVQPWFTIGRQERENTEIIMKDQIPYFHYKREDRYERVPDSIHEAGSGGGENETRYVFDQKDARERICIVKAERLTEDGFLDFTKSLVRVYGDSRFVISGGIVNTFYSNVYYVGMMNFYSMLYDEPELIKYMSERLLEKNIEVIRAMAAAGGDVIYIDDATATSDMVSPQMYEEFSLPYMIREVNEIHRLGKKAMIVYFGGIADRLDLIASIGADILVMEASMKGYQNDLDTVMRKVGGKMCVAGNLNPYGDVEITTDSELEDRMAAQASIARTNGGRFFCATGSPLTPNTTVGRLRKFIDLGHML